jgi:uncharacterized protein (UPF0332 family)
VSDVFTPAVFMRKAERALSGARLLLNADNAEGACNRAYYAMFDAAHAALFALGIEEIRKPIKTHSGLVAKFGLHIVRGNHLAASYGEAINTVQRFRQVADYSGDPVSIADAAWAVKQSETFVAAVREKFMGKPPERGA